MQDRLGQQEIPEQQERLVLPAVLEQRVEQGLRVRAERLVKRDQQVPLEIPVQLVCQVLPDQREILVPLEYQDPQVPQVQLGMQVPLDPQE
jgi:formate dehydrogenase maturation protein FdhE